MVRMFLSVYAKCCKTFGLERDGCDGRNNEWCLKDSALMGEKKTGEEGS